MDLSRVQLEDERFSSTVTRQKYSPHQQYSKVITALDDWLKFHPTEATFVTKKRISSGDQNIWFWPGLIDPFLERIEMI